MQKAATVETLATENGAQAAGGHGTLPELKQEILQTTYGNQTEAGQALRNFATAQGKQVKVRHALGNDQLHTDSRAPVRPHVLLARSRCPRARSFKALAHTLSCTQNQRKGPSSSCGTSFVVRCACALDKGGVLKDGAVCAFAVRMVKAKLGSKPVFVVDANFSSLCWDHTAGLCTAKPKATLYNLGQLQSVHSAFSANPAVTHTQLAAAVRFADGIELTPNETARLRQSFASGNKSSFVANFAKIQEFCIRLTNGNLNKIVALFTTVRADQDERASAAASERLMQQQMPPPRPALATAAAPGAHAAVAPPLWFPRQAATVSRSGGCAGGAGGSGGDDRDENDIGAGCAGGAGGSGPDDSVAHAALAVLKASGGNTVLQSASNPKPESRFDWVWNRPCAEGAASAGGAASGGAASACGSQSNWMWKLQGTSGVASVPTPPTMMQHVRAYFVVCDEREHKQR